MTNDSVEMSLLDTQVRMSTLHPCAGIPYWPSESLAEKRDLVNAENARICSIYSVILRTSQSLPTNI